MNSIATPRVRDLQGLWRRSLLVRPDGTRDAATRVRWLQGTEAYIDLRQPASLPQFPAKRRLADISRDECAVLALQEGFAGHLTFDGAHFEWARDIDFQPKGLHSDAGSLSWDGETLIERGRDVDYIEHWHRDEAGVAPPTAAVSLRDVECGIKGSLLRVGTVFMFARDRSGFLAAHGTLLQCVAEAYSLEAAQALIDCEISCGVVSAAGYLITASTLPHRVGDSLDPRYSGVRLRTMDRAPAGKIVARQWEISKLDGDLDAVAGKSTAF
jgi:hypothetical protein